MPKYITLKEAGELSGYAPDYIGQLIRQGKLPGKQVYSSVAWLTTAEAVREYLRPEGGGKRKATLKQKLVGLFRRKRAAGFLKTIFWLLSLAAAGFILVLFYIFSVSFENKLQARALEKLEKGQVYATPYHNN